MFGLSHLLAGLIIGKLTGNYFLAVVFSVGVDIDHLIPLIRSGAYKSWKKFYAFATDESDPFGSPRIFLHSIYGFALVSSISFLISYKAGYIVCLCYLVHLMMDMVDGSEFRLFYPHGPNFIGPFKYFSKSELALNIVMFAVFVII